MSSLKEITKEAILSHGLLDNTKRNNSDQNLRGALYSMSILYCYFVYIALLNPAISAAPGARLDSAISGINTSTTVPPNTTGVHSTPIQPLLGVAPLGPISLGQDKVFQLRMLEAAFKHLPDPSDSEKVR